MPFRYPRRRGTVRYQRRYKRFAPTTLAKRARGQRGRYYRWRRKFASKALAFRPRWPNALPAKTIRTFTYNDSAFAASWGAVHQSCNVYRGNSLYDPDETGVGVQPYGYDQWTDLYADYKVCASKITVYAVSGRYADANLEANFTPIKMYVIATRENPLTNEDPSDLANTRFRKMIMFKYDDQTKNNKVSHFMKTKTMYPSLSMSNNNFVAAYNANPTFGWYWQVYFDCSDWSPGADPDLYFDVRIKYYAILSKPIQLNES